jgi:hypothetical protein
VGTAFGSGDAGKWYNISVINGGPELNDFLEVDAEALASAVAAFADWEAEWWEREGGSRGRSQLRRQYLPEVGGGARISLR